MVIVVTGGREYKDAAKVIEVLAKLHWERGPITKLHHGGAEGADALASRWAFLASVPRQQWRADWNRYKGMAGPIRNGEMLRGAKPDLVVAFPGGRGTANCVKQAKEIGIEVMEVEY